MKKLIQSVMRFISRKFKELKACLAKRRDAQIVNQIVKRIYKDTGIYLNSWQREYVFHHGKYMSEAKAGRCNGKTIANVFRMLMMSKTTFFIDTESLVIIVGSHWGYDTVRFMKEDANVKYRRHHFVFELKSYYDILKKDKWFKGKLCDIVFGRFIIQKVNDLDEYKDEERKED